MASNSSLTKIKHRLENAGHKEVLKFPQSCALLKKKMKAEMGLEKCPDVMNNFLLMKNRRLGESKKET